MARTECFASGTDNIETVLFLDHRDSEGRPSPFAIVKLVEEGVSLYVDDILRTRKIVVAMSDALYEVEKAMIAIPPQERR